MSFVKNFVAANMVLLSQFPGVQSTKTNEDGQDVWSSRVSLGMTERGLRVDLVVEISQENSTEDLNCQTKVELVWVYAGDESISRSFSIHPAETAVMRPTILFWANRVLGEKQVHTECIGQFVCAVRALNSTFEFIYLRGVA